MLRSTKRCVCLCANLLNNNKCYRRIEPRELRYPCRYFASSYKGSGEKKSRDPCAKEEVKDTKGLNLPDDDCAQPISPTCKRTTMGSKMPGRPAVMDQLPKPSVDCKWEKDHKQTGFKKNFHLIAGIILLAIALVPLYNNFLPTIEVPIKEESDLKPVKKKSKRPRPIQKTPSDSSDIPDAIPYLLIGGGTASFSAFRAIKSVDPKAQVLVIGNEPYYPYMRPPLSKEMFYVEDRTVAAKLKFKQWNGTERSLFYEPEDFYSDCKELLSEDNGGVAVARGWTVKQINPTERTVLLEDGKKITYQKCLLATGSRPNNHPVFEEAEEEVKEKVSLYRNVFDYEELEGVIEDGAKCIAIVGGSFLGSELACALARRGKKKNLKVVQIFKENGNMGKILPDYLSKWTTTKVQKEGVQVIPNCQVVDAMYKEDDDTISLALDNGKSLVADHVILALGVKPNTDLADASHLELDKEQGGFLVNAELEARSNLYVAGDCACFYDAKLGRRRVEHHDHAVVSGRLAGENMAGAGKPYFHQSMFWSDLGPDVGFEAIGIVDSNLPTVGVYAKMTKKDKPKAVQTSKDSDGMRSSAEDEAAMAVNVDDEDTEAALDESGVGEGEEGEKGEEGDKSEEGENAEKEKKEQKKKPLEDFGKGVIFYLRDGIVVGIILWNVFNRMSVARQVLSDEKKYEDLNEVAKLFNIHKD